MYDDSIVPSWANDIFIAKGLGFEVLGLKALMWGFFDEQYDGDERKIESNLALFIDDCIKNGRVAMAIDVVKQTNSAPPPRPVRQSKLAEFEEKMERYLTGE